MFSIKDLLVSIETPPVPTYDVNAYTTVNPEDFLPVSLIAPSPTGPWICGGAALRWYKGESVDLADIDVFCRDLSQLRAIEHRLVTVGKASSTYQSNNAITYMVTYGSVPKSWKIQLILNSFYDTIEDAINSFDITACKIGTDGQWYTTGPSTIHDVNNKILRMVPPLKAGALKRYAKYVAYGYTPVKGLHAWLAADPAVNWTLDMAVDYDDV